MCNSKKWRFNTFFHLVIAIFQIHNSLCEWGLNNCPLDYKPVCAIKKDGSKKTFGNLCFFETYSSYFPSWKIINEGECTDRMLEVLREGTNYSCKKKCKFLKRPLCAFDSKANYRTFINRCYFENAQCDNSDWEVVYSGVCLILS